ncbi:MAG: TRAP transporter permease [Ignavibacteriales bacterium]
MGRRKQLGVVWRWITNVFSIIGVILSVLYIFNIRPFGFNMVEPAYLQYLLVLFLAPVFITYRASKRETGDEVPWYDCLLFAACVGTSFYFATHAIQGVMEGWEYTAPFMQTVLAVVTWLLVVEAVRRASGTPLAIVCLAFSFYPLFADLMPGFLKGVPSTFTGAARAHVFGLESILGIPLRTVGTQLIGFIIFGAALEVTGASDFLLNLSTSFFGRQPGGSAKIAVVSSALFGSLSGSVISNIATIGSFAIPEMKKSGYKPEYAGAIECCAATGGSLMPPVMGAAAFIMASFLKVPYIQICIAALVPSILYYLPLFIQSDAHAKLVGMKGKPSSEIPSLRDTLRGGWYYVLAFITLIYFMTYVKVESRAPYFATIVLFLVAAAKKETRISRKVFIKFISTCGRLLFELTAILAGIGLIIGGLTITGVSQAFSRELVSAVGDNSFLLLLACAITSAILGMGMTVTACYTFLAVVVAPAMVRAEVNIVAAHMFVMYWGLVSYLTPPVAVGAITAAGVAGADPVKTGWTSVRLGIAAYIVPFAFAYNPALVAQGTAVDAIIAFIPTAIGVAMVAYGLEGYFPFVGRTPLAARGAALIGGLLLLFPQWHLRLAGISIAVITVAVARFGFGLREARAN